MEQKKETKAQIERRIKNAVVFVPKDKDTSSIFFDDKGVRLTVTEDSAVIATGYHKHVFDAYNISQGISRPFIYTKRIIEIANENDCLVIDSKGNVTGRSYALLLDVLNKKEDKSEYNIVYYYSWWLTIIFDGLYSIGETEAETFMTYFDYCCIIAKNAVLLSEKTESMTNRQFIDRFIDNLKEFTESMTENVVFEKKTDDELARENISASLEMEMNEQINDDGKQH